MISDIVAFAIKYPTPYGFPDGGVAEIREAPSFKGASFIGPSH